MRYSIEAGDQMYLKGYMFLSSSKNMGNMGNSITKNTT